MRIAGPVAYIGGPVASRVSTDVFIISRVSTMLHGEITGLKVPGNYSGPLWSNNFSISFLERQKTQHFMMSGFLDPWEPVFMDLNIPNYFAKYKTNGHICFT